MTPICEIDTTPAPSAERLLEQEATEFLAKHGFAADGRSAKERMGAFEDAHYRSTSTPTGGRIGYRRGK